jgi:zinc transporter ZupT
LDNHSHGTSDDINEHAHSHGQGNDDHESEHLAGIWKGCGAVAGVYIFFLIERTMQIRRARKEKRHQHSEMIHKNGGIEMNSVNKKKKESIGGGGASDTNNNNNSQIQQQTALHANKDLKYISQYLPNNACSVSVDHHDSENEIKHLHQHSGLQACDTTDTNKHKKQNSDEGIILGVENNLIMDKDENQLKLISNNDENNLDEDVPISFKNEKEEQLNTFHSHHSHSHKYKSHREKAHHDHHIKHEKQITDVKLIAWMVIMGDGLHNFADGLAIGASFASSLPVGLGTSIAVLCHELPHEIGDFAVLRRAGVSLKKALVFNAVSGVMCMFGVLVGLLIGEFPKFTSFTFSFIAGTFLYISLVDMVSIYLDLKIEGVRVDVQTNN